MNLECLRPNTNYSKGLSVWGKGKKIGRYTERHWEKSRKKVGMLIKFKQLFSHNTSFSQGKSVAPQESIPFRTYSISGIGRPFLAPPTRLLRAYARASGPPLPCPPLQACLRQVGGSGSGHRPNLPKKPGNGPFPGPWDGTIFNFAQSPYIHLYHRYFQLNPLLAHPVRLPGGALAPPALAGIFLSTFCRKILPLQGRTK